MSSSRRALAFFLMLLATGACGRGRDTAPPVATPSVSVSRPDAVIGGPIDMRYRFAVAPDAPPFGEDYWVFVHVLDADGELMWTDDHEPPTGTRQWKPGASVEYTRTMFVPKFPYVGETRVEIGLVSPATGTRLPLAGETEGQRAYQVATFNLRLDTESLFVVFREGWHDTESADEGTRVEWQWSTKTGTLSFPNPRRNVTVYLELDQPAAAFSEPQRVELRIGADVIDAFELPPGRRELRRVALRADQMGSGDTVDVTVNVDRTFVPAAVPALKSTDPRELGVRVFRVYVQGQ